MRSTFSIVGFPFRLLAFIPAALFVSAVWMFAPKTYNSSVLHDGCTWLLRG